MLPDTCIVDCTIEWIHSGKRETIFTVLVRAIIALAAMLISFCVNVSIPVLLGHDLFIEIDKPKSVGIGRRAP